MNRFDNLMGIRVNRTLRDARMGSLVTCQGGNGLAQQPWTVQSVTTVDSLVEWEWNFTVNVNRCTEDGTLRERCEHAYSRASGGSAPVSARRSLSPRTNFCCVFLLTATYKRMNPFVNVM